MEQNKNFKKIVFPILGILAISVAVLLNLPGIKNEKGKVYKEEKNLTSQKKQELETKIIDFKSRAKNLSKETDDNQFNDVYAQLANAYREVGDYKEALNVLDKTSERNENSSEVWSLYSDIYKDMKNIPKARESIKKATEIESDKIKYWQKLIELSQDQGTQVLNDLYVNALAKTFDRIEIVVDYARFAEKTGNLQVSLEYWQKAAELNRDNKNVYLIEADRIAKALEKK
jgi:tetratricopeptide (TPR) repeat protein